MFSKSRASVWIAAVAVVLTSLLAIPTFAGITISSEEQKLYQLLNEYRSQHSLPAIPLSVSLTHVAQTHAKDLANYHQPQQNGQCNLHSWSNYGSWNGCCYTSDHAQAQCMWDKPKELTGYTGNGFEISAVSTDMNAENALNMWKKSSGHNVVILNRNSWAKFTWNAVGVGIYKNYAVVWFGKENDPAGTVEISNASGSLSTADKLALKLKSDALFNRLENLYSLYLSPKATTEFLDDTYPLFYRLYSNFYRSILATYRDGLYYSINEQWYYLTTLDEAEQLYCNGKC